jgi:hypothetical protein
MRSVIATIVRRAVCCERGSQQKQFRKSALTCEDPSPRGIAGPRCAALRRYTPQPTRPRIRSTQCPHKAAQALDTTLWQRSLYTATSYRCSHARTQSRKA